MVETHRYRKTTARTPHPQTLRRGALCRRRRRRPAVSCEMTRACGSQYLMATRPRRRERRRRPIRPPGTAPGARHRKPDRNVQARTAGRRSAASATSVGRLLERPARAWTTGPAYGAAPMTPKRQGGARSSARRATRAGRPARPARGRRTGAAIGVHKPKARSGQARTAGRRSAPRATCVGVKAARPARARPTGSVTSAAPTTPKRGGARVRTGPPRLANRAVRSGRRPSGGDGGVGAII